MTQPLEGAPGKFEFNVKGQQTPRRGLTSVGKQVAQEAEEPTRPAKGAHAG